MKRIYAMAGATLVGLLLTGCGANYSPSVPSLNNQVSNSSGSTSGNIMSTENTSNQTMTDNPAESSLVPFTGFSSEGIEVKVPTGWTESTKNGGDYTSVSFTNPSDPKEQLRVLYSTCVGCYMGQTNQPSPANVIGESHTTDVKQSQLIATYNFLVSGNPYQGSGIVQLSANQSGYAEVDTLMPKTDSALREDVLNSFHYSS